VHLSDLSWANPGETAVRDFKKGQEVEAVVLAIDVERERISLGIKQLEGDPFTNFVAMHDKGSVVNGTVRRSMPRVRSSRSVAMSRAISARRRSRAIAWRICAQG